jgi:hypothetical protein
LAYSTGERSVVITCLGPAVDVAVEQFDAGSGEAVGAHVAPSESPLVVLFGEDGADEADDRGKKAAKASSGEIR